VRRFIATRLLFFCNAVGDGLHRGNDHGLDEAIMGRAVSMEYI